jgi:hypothetical protein
MPTSQEIKDQLREQSRFIPEAPDDDEGELGYTPSDASLLDREGIIEIPPSISGESVEEEEPQVDESGEFDSEAYRGDDLIYDGLTDKQRLAEERRNAEFERRKRLYESQQTPSYEQPPVDQAMAQQQAWNAFNQDQIEFVERYGPELTSQFVKDMILERVRFPKNLAEIENPVEHIFLDWVSSPRIMKTLNGKQIENIIRSASSGPHLKSRISDLSVPSRVKPPPKPKVKVKKEFSVADLSMDDLKEAINLLYKAHPEKFNK